MAYGPGNMPPLPPKPQGMPPLPPTPQRMPPLPPIPQAMPALPPVPLPTPALIVTPPVMPPLPTAPPNMPALPATPHAAPPRPGTPPPVPSWTAARNPSAQIVQQQYVDRRLHELQANYTPAKQEALRVIEVYLRSKMDAFKKQQEIPIKQLERIYNEVERNLQAADLTINFQAKDWFLNENPYDTYTQMYERSMVDGQMALRKNAMNDDPRLRAQVDNQVTFPEDWHGVQSPQQRGLSPGAQGVDRLMRQMDTGSLVPKPMADQFSAFNASNTGFNPHTKQIFLGLNYGRRPHGSAKNFGWSFFVLKSELKQRCLFYALDTFQYQGTKQHAGNLQTPYTDLGTILRFGLDPAPVFAVLNPLEMAIMKSCYEGKLLDDNNSTILGNSHDNQNLLEAHHFGQLNFREHVEYMVISPRASGDAGFMDSSTWAKGAFDPATWPAVVANAHKFAEKHGFKIYQA